MSLTKLKEIGIGLAVVLLQVIFFRHLDIYSMHPDVVLIFLVWYMTKRNRTAALLMAALLGFTQDALLGLWGLNMFSKTLMVFILYNWIPNEPAGKSQLPRVMIFVFIGGFIQNLFLIALSSTVEVYTAELLFWRNWLGNSIYTSVTAGIIQLFRIRRNT